MFSFYIIVVVVKPWSQEWLIAAGAYCSFCNMKWLGVFLLPLDGMLVHRRPLPHNLLGFPQQFAGFHLIIILLGGERHCESAVSCHDTVSPARARTQTTHSENEHTNHEATVLITKVQHYKFYI